MGRRTRKWPKKGWHFGARSIGIRSIAFADRNASWPKRLFALLAQSLIMIGSHQVQKAFGKAGKMVNVKSGKDWIPKGEAKVVMATVTKAKTLKANTYILFFFPR